MAKLLKGNDAKLMGLRDLSYDCQAAEIILFFLIVGALAVIGALIIFITKIRR